MAGSATTSAAVFRQIAPQFRVPDVVRTAEWYRDYLGFSIGEYYRPAGHGDDAPVFVHVARDGLEIQIGRTLEGHRPHSNSVDGVSFDAYVWVSGIESLFEEFRSRGVTFSQWLISTDYQMKEFVVVDCDGHTLAFGE